MVINRARSLNFEAIRYGNYHEFILADWFLVPVLGNPFDKELYNWSPPKTKCNLRTKEKI